MLADDCINCLVGAPEHFASHEAEFDPIGQSYIAACMLPVGEERERVIEAIVQLARVMP